jgi:hypothetical protein
VQAALPCTQQHKQQQRQHMVNHCSSKAAADFIWWTCRCTAAGYKLLLLLLLLGFSLALCPAAVLANAPLSQGEPPAASAAAPLP